MNLYETKIMALIPGTNELVEWAGPLIPGISIEDANDYCYRNGLGYCEITGISTGHIPCDDRTYKADWDNHVNNYYKNN